MKKLYDKDEIWFAVIWIVIYVVGFANMDAISADIGIEKLLTVPFGLILSVAAYAFIRKHQLFDHFGLCRVKVSARTMLYFIPLIVMSFVNFLNGVTLNCSIVETLLYILSMCFVGFLEEVIFRGFLFKGMSKENPVSAIVVSSLTFGVGHIVNLLLGAPVFETLLQLVYASAIGFCYTAIFIRSGSVIPCILSHAFVNSTSVFALTPTAAMSIITTISLVALNTAYGAWLLGGRRK